MVKLNLHPNSPKIQLGVKRLLLKKIIPTGKREKVDEQWICREEHTRMNDIRYGKIND